MLKEKLISLTNYLNQLKFRLELPTPPKHKDHPESFRNFLKNEIRIINDVLEAERLERTEK